MLALPPFLLPQSGLVLPNKLLLYRALLSGEPSLRHSTTSRKVCGFYTAREIPKPIKLQAAISAFFSLTERPQRQQNKIKTYHHCFLTHHFSTPITNTNLQNKQSQIRSLH